MMATEWRVIQAAIDTHRCVLSVDGWCFTHSSSLGPIYCDPEHAEPRGDA